MSLLYFTYITLKLYSFIKIFVIFQLATDGATLRNENFDHHESVIFRGKRFIFFYTDLCKKKSNK